MGMFDSVYAPCPKCGTKAEFQSKSGSCTLRNYNLDDVPHNVVIDAAHSVEKCESCGTLFKIRYTIKTFAWVEKVNIKVPDGFDYDDSDF